MLDATEVYRGIWVGSAPEPGYYGGRFDVIVLTSLEYQPPAYGFPGVIVRRFPFNDTGRPSDEDWREAWRAASAVAHDVSVGRRVLISCNMGRNRSALVAALAIHMLTGMSGARAGRIVRDRRTDLFGVRALSNDAFRGMLRSLR